MKDSSGRCRRAGQHDRPERLYLRKTHHYRLRACPTNRHGYPALCLLGMSLWRTVRRWPKQVRGRVCRQPAASKPVGPEQRGTQLESKEPHHDAPAKTVTSLPVAPEQTGARGLAPRHELAPSVTATPRPSPCWVEACAGAKRRCEHEAGSAPPPFPSPSGRRWPAGPDEGRPPRTGSSLGGRGVDTPWASAPCRFVRGQDRGMLRRTFSGVGWMTAQPHPRIGFG